MEVGIVKSRFHSSRDDQSELDKENYNTSYCQCFLETEGIDMRRYTIHSNRGSLLNLYRDNHSILEESYLFFY